MGIEPIPIKLEANHARLQKLMPHKNPIMTQRYAHLRDEALRKSSELAGKIIGEAGKKEDEPNVVYLKDPTR